MSQRADITQIIGGPIRESAFDQLSRFATWLETEGVAAGAIGPSEDVWNRHILDSLAFATAWDTAPANLTDIGTGAGLPGLVLAIIWPSTVVDLVDRSGRRTRLLRRISRILELENLRILQTDVDHIDLALDAMVMRAVFPPPRAVAFAADHLSSGGRAVVALSRSQPPDPSIVDVASAAGLDARIEVVEMLDPPAWLLIMDQT